MSPPPAARHSRRQARIAALLERLLPHGTPFTECAISTADGVKATDVAWLRQQRSEIDEEPVLFTRAPEICVEIFSPSNTPAEIDEKRALYFDPAPRKSGFATSTVRSLFFLIKMMMLLLLLFARRSQTGFLKGRLHRFGHGPAELSRRGYGDRGKCD
jgi:hypothetical protein